jgi:outer membrane protein, multidrug efflux system
VSMKMWCIAKSKTLGVLATLLAVVSMVGCSPTSEPTGFWGKLWRLEVGPDYKRPEIESVKEFRSQIGPVEANSLADYPWWRVFDDKALQGLIAQALTHNYDLQMAAARVEQARAMVWVAASQFYPQADYQAFAGREKTFVPIPRDERAGNITFNTFGGLLNAVWELDVWGRIRRSTEAARANLFAQEAMRRGVMLMLVSDTARGYFSLIELDLELAIAQESARVYKQTLDLFTQRFEYGQDSKLPVARAQAAFDSSLANIAALKRAIVQQENALSVLVGSYPGEIARGAALTAQSMPRAPLGLTTDLVERRPDLLEAQQNMIGANAEVGVAIANFFPRIGLSALYGYQAPHIEDVVDSSFSIWNIFGGVTGPIFQGGRILHSYYAQQAFWDASIAQYKQRVLVAFREVSDALVAQDTLASQRLALQHQVKALRAAVDLSLLRYNVGRAGYFEVLEAEQLLFPAEDELAQTERDQLLAVVNLYKALGGGWGLSNSEWMQPR